MTRRGHVESSNDSSTSSPTPTTSDGFESRVYGIERTAASKSAKGVLTLDNMHAARSSDPPAMSERSLKKKLYKRAKAA